jgi:hypothetical protein
LATLFWQLLEVGAAEIEIKKTTTVQFIFVTPPLPVPQQSLLNEYLIRQVPER